MSYEKMLRDQGFGEDIVQELLTSHKWMNKYSEGRVEKRWREYCAEQVLEMFFNV